MPTAPCRRFVARAALATLLFASSAYAGFAASFEGAEGYIPGPIGGQLGWLGDLDIPTDTIITTNPYSGFASLRVSADGGYDGAFHLGASTPAFSTSGRYVEASQEIAINKLGEADFVVQTIDSVAGLPAVQLQFTYQGDLIINGTDTGYDWLPEKTMHVAIQHDRQLKIARVLVDSVEVLGDVSIAGISLVDRIQFATDDAISDEAASMYVDDVTVSPEPATACLLMAGSLLAQRRRNIR